MERDEDQEFYPKIQNHFPSRYENMEGDSSEIYQKYALKRNYEQKKKIPRSKKLVDSIPQIKYEEIQKKYDNIGRFENLNNVSSVALKSNSKKISHIVTCNVAPVSGKNGKNGEDGKEEQNGGLIFLFFSFYFYIFILLFFYFYFYSAFFYFYFYIFLYFYIFIFIINKR